ncbi:MAG: hypothetical protein KAR05_01670 [Candidatus Omnitrophica bacterium]|nr:hypothetical protein [Candidatus Omnitrophota bacterium]
MTFITIILFFVYTFGLGYTLTSYIKKNSFETFVLRVSIGLGALPVLGTVLNIIHIPLDWRIIFCIAFIYPARAGISFLRNSLSARSLKIPPKNIIILFIIFLITALIYCGGSFNYPWLEDDDPWSHAAGVKYISVEKNLNVSSGEFQYINPYPPGYDFILGILHQTHYSIYWVLKFFNGLIAALGILFFYNFILDFTQDKKKALWASFALACVPCYLSHFIWAHSLAVTLFFPALSTLLRAQDDRRFILPGSIVISGIFLTQPTQSIKFCVLILILFMAYSIMKRRLATRMITIMAVAGLLSLTWWGPVIYEIKSGTSEFIQRQDNEILGSRTNSTSAFKDIFDPAGGSATRDFTFNDYFTAPQPNMVNNPLSLEKGIFILSLLGLLILIKQLFVGDPDKRIYCWTILGWLLFTFLGMNSKTFNLPIGLFAFRFWMLFAIPVSMLSAEACLMLIRAMGKPFLAQLMVILIIILIVCTSGYAKYRVNTSYWTRGVFWTSLNETLSYIWMRDNFPPDTRVFSFKDNLFVIGMDMKADFWREEYKADFENAFESDIQTLHKNLKNHQFKYLIISPKDTLAFGFDEVNKKISDLVSHKDFQLVLNHKKGARIFKIIY